MKICVTGSTGFIGNHLVHALLQDGHEIHCLVRSQSDLSGFPESSKLSFHRGKNHAREMAEVFECNGIEMVIHLASLFIAEHKSDQIADLVDSNIKYGTELLQASIETGVKHFLNTGTTWQHFRGEESSAVCLYAATKQAFENILNFYADSYEIKTVTLELCDTFGPGDKRRKILTILLEAAGKSEPLDLSPGDQLIDLVYIDDVISAYRILISQMNEKRIGNGKCQISSGSPLSIKDLLKTVCEVTQRPINPNWGGRPYRNREVMIPWTSSPLVEGWRPEISLTQGIQKLVKSH